MTARAPAAPDRAQLDRWERAHAWHPFTQSAEAALFPPLHIARGAGPWLFDVAGRRFFDGHASLWTNVHGHADPELDAAVAQQLGRVAHATWLGLAHPAAGELAARLAAHTDLERVFFSDNGACAVEIALKLSRQYWQLAGRPEKREIAGFTGAYHGDTLGAMAASDSGAFHARFADWFLPAHHVPAPLCRELAGEVLAADAAASLAALAALLETRGGRIAAVVLEPSVQGAAGLRQQPPGFARAVAALCRAHDVHLILDEVFVGFGRLGAVVASRANGVTPDFLCLGKGLGGGYLPLAATLAREEIHHAFCAPFEEGRTFFHGHTFTANPLACAAALASLDKLEKLIATGALATRIAAFGRIFRETFGHHSHAAAPRQRGLTAAFELVPDAAQPARGYPPAARTGLQVCLEARRRGLILRPLGDTLLLVPAPVCDEAEFRFLCDTLAAAMTAALDGPGRPRARFAEFAADFDDAPSTTPTRSP